MDIMLPVRVVFAVGESGASRDKPTWPGLLTTNQSQIPVLGIKPSYIGKMHVNHANAGQPL